MIRKQPSRLGVPRRRCLLGSVLKVEVATLDKHSKSIAIDE